ncbi:CBS domain-containing protein [Pseudoflavitalea rhizosphaerae]|uniref:CBS domain-containing protein n=1 Tax=Pseudoflavitalea rhizosphaerae TaxID=1884793 RepID=UPI001F49C392|nr:CBS domain-containing protein [Pseudoflavitalea rhizosphaerae]
MLNKELISSAIPSLSPGDTVFQAMELMQEFHVAQLPVVAEEKYLGMASEDDLMDKDENALLQQFANYFSRISARAGSHFLESVQMANEHNLSIVPVTEKDGEFIGVITVSDLLKQLGKTTGANEPGGIIVLEMEQRNFSFSEISKLIETNDAQITQLNTHWDSNTSAFYVTIKVSKFEISDIIATFQRYEYQVKYYFGEELYENELRSNYDHLMNYLNI